MGEGSPYWYTDFDDPKPTPAPFQIELIGENYESFYEVTLFDILKSNLNNCPSNLLIAAEISIFLFFLQ